MRDPSFLGWLDGEELARVYASADLFLFASATDAFGQVILEAQASGLPVVAVDRGGPASLITHRQPGLLAAPNAYALADAVISLAGGGPLYERLRTGGLEAARERSWEAALRRLAVGYGLALERRSVASARGAA